MCITLGLWVQSNDRVERTRNLPRFSRHFYLTHLGGVEWEEPHNQDV